MFELLVARFHTPVPQGLSDYEEKVWVKSKKPLLQVRVISIMKGLILNHELFDPEEKRAVAQNIKIFALSVQDDVSAAMLLVRAANRIVRLPHCDLISLICSLAGRERSRCPEADRRWPRKRPSQANTPKIDSEVEVDRCRFD